MKAPCWIIVPAAACWLALAPGAHAQGPAPVRTAPVAKREVVERRMVTGELRALRQAEVASQEGGLVAEMLVDIGSRVEADQELARLDDERLQLEKQRATAERAAAASTIAEASSIRDRWASEIASLQEAAQRGAGNARERRDADAEFHQAAARFEKAERDVEVYDARLALLERRLKDMHVRAPFAGVVSKKLTERGEWVSEGDSVCEILATNEFELALDVPQRYLPVLASTPLSGADLVVRLDAAGDDLVLENVRLVPNVDQRSRTFTLVALVPNPRGSLAAGLSVVAWIPTGASAQHLIVPTDAVMRNDMGAFVYAAKVMGEGPPKAVPTTVEVLFEMPGEVVVRAGSLAEGDQIVVEGNERLYPMAQLAPTGSPTTSNPGPAAGEG